MRRLKYLPALALLVLSISLASPLHAGILLICDANLSPGDDIQAAISGATAGDVICFAPGTYSPASPIAVDVSVILAGAQYGVDPRTFAPISSVRVAGDAVSESIIDGGGNAGGIFEIDADNVEINGLQITNAEDDLIFSASNSGIAGTIVRNNIINNAIDDEGIQLRDATNPLIEYNRIFDISGDGINTCCDSSGMTIQFNQLDDISSSNGAIYLYDAPAEGFNGWIRGNVITGVNVNDGIKLGNKGGGDEDALGSLVENNKITNTVQDGITAYSSRNQIIGNDITGSSSSNGAIFVEFDPTNNDLNNNRVMNNTTRGFRIGKSELYPKGTLVNNNCISGNTVAGLTFNYDDEDLNAENNW